MSTRWCPIRQIYFFTISGNNKNIKEVTVIDTEGKIIKNYQSPLPMQFSIAEIANGTYQIKIVDTFGHATIRKLTIVRQ
ncbi:MAG: T9SS type A sorting domain-containing protein [Bacteroidetes bacterium]|nr:T9SS type A sorting domain-containing protein [Bacteroidota bacterium]